MLEALGHHIDGVGANIQVGEAVETVRLCNRDMLHLGRDIGHRDGCFVNDSASGVNDRALNTSRSRSLRVAFGGKREYPDTKNNGEPAMNLTGTPDT
jgi:hypothetical protein